MAIYHFSAKVISRSAGSSAVASAAYRSGSRLRDERLDRDHDFSNKSGVVHSEVMLPEGTPERLGDRSALWNEVEATELRKDAQLSREIEFAIPRELSQQQGIELARGFVAREFVERGMIADMNVHWDLGADGLAKPHAHVMLTMREVGEDGFGVKVREWNKSGLVCEWRERWETHVNEWLAELDIDARIDHRSLEAQGIALEPQTKIGAPSQRMGPNADRLIEHHAIAHENGERIIVNPDIALDAITKQQATFTRRDLAMFIHRHSDGKDQFDLALSAVQNSENLVALGVDGRGNERFTSCDMLDVEARLHSASHSLAERELHQVNERDRDKALVSAEQRGLILSGEQRDAFDHITKGKDVGVVIGYAGTGKSAMLGVARKAWEQSGYEVRGVALSGIAAENLEGGSGIQSRTIASMEHGWQQGRDLLTSRDVLVIDEAGMVGTRQMERVLSHACEAGAKVILVGDPQQLQAIEAGAAFRSIAEQVGSIEITAIRRQHEGWQRDATRHLATGRTAAALSAYRDHDMLHGAETCALAREQLIDRWDADRIANPDDRRIILTHTNNEVRELNLAARERLRASGELGHDIAVRVERGERNFAEGDRVMFLRNDREMGVKNGTIGTLQSLDRQRMAVLLGDGRCVAFDLKDYAQIDHGYAATIHKSQGVTVDRAHVLVTPGMDQHSSYVALSRHRDSVQIHYGRDDFADDTNLARTLSRERAKDMASDYGRDEGIERRFAERRGITLQQRVAALVRKVVPEKVRDLFDGLLPVPKQSEPEVSDGVARKLAVERHARAVTSIFAMQEDGFDATPTQLRELHSARGELDALRDHASKDMESAYKCDPSLAQESANGRPERARDAMINEAEVRTNPHLRADRFVERWQQLGDRSDDLYRNGRYAASKDCRLAMADMAKGLERDPQIESILRSRKLELGITMESTRSLGDDLAFSLGLGRGRGVGI
jgi:Ti-type conjugative transfer relaxase TraA